MKEVISARSLGKRFPSGLRTKVVLRDLSFKIERGTTVGLLGANGSGKTTLLNLCMGFSYPSAGKLLVLGQEASLARDQGRLGYLPEKLEFSGFMTGAENLSFLEGVRGRYSNKEIAAILKEVGLSQNTVPVSKYSKGMRQRLGLAQAFLGAAELVLLDEPFSGLDPLARREIGDLLIRSKQMEQTILFSTHSIEDLKYCDLVLVLRSGKLLWNGTKESFLRQLSDLEEKVYQGVTL